MTSSACRTTGISGPVANLYRLKRLWLLLIATFAGCSPAPFPMEPVTGVVTVEGKPFCAGQVMFFPIAQQENSESGKPGFSLLDENGTFQLSTYSRGDGAVVGQHWVRLYSLDHRRTADDKHVPAFKMVSINSTPVEVKAGEQNHFEFELSLDQFPKAKRRR